jgi:hypothetical protein
MDVQLVVCVIFVGRGVLVLADDVEGSRAVGGSGAGIRVSCTAVLTKDASERAGRKALLSGRSTIRYHRHVAI